MATASVLPCPVKDPPGSPAQNGKILPGVSIPLKGNTFGTTADSEGNYPLSLPDNSTGGTYYREEGIIRGNDFDRLSGRFSVDNKAGDRIKPGAGMGVTYPADYRMGTGTNPGAGGFGLAQTLMPVYPYFNGDGSCFDPCNGGPGQSGRVGETYRLCRTGPIFTAVPIWYKAPRVATLCHSCSHPLTFLRKRSSNPLAQSSMG